jgi:phospholipid/cholesterol/gamma-HCH transport system substrate-binding protein
MMSCRLLTTLPSQKQLHWSQLRVGLTVVVASVTLMVLIFVMSGTGGWFTSKITLRSYFDNAGGLREGAPVRLAGVDIGNVKSIRIEIAKPTTPVEVTMKVNTKYSSYLRKDSVTLLSTAGVLGETYVDVNSSQAKGPEARDGDVLPARDQPELQEGSIGKVIYDPALYNQLNATVTEFKGLVDDIQSGKGSLGPLFTSDEAYKKAVAVIDKLNGMVDELQQGKGTAGKLLKDPELFDNANKTVANVRQLTDDINAGKGALGKFSHDQEFADKLQTTINNLAALSDRLEKGEGTAGLLFKDPGLYNNSNQMLVETRELVKSIRENPKKYLTFHVKVF